MSALLASVWSEKMEDAASEELEARKKSRECRTPLFALWSGVGREGERRSERGITSYGLQVSAV